MTWLGPLQCSKNASLAWKAEACQSLVKPHPPSEGGSLQTTALCLRGSKSSSGRWHAFHHQCTEYMTESKSDYVVFYLKGKSQLIYKVWLNTHWTRVGGWLLSCVYVPVPSIQLSQKPPTKHLADVWQLVCTDSRVTAITGGLPATDTKKIPTAYIWLLIHCLYLYLVFVCNLTQNVLSQKIILIFHLKKLN